MSTRLLPLAGLFVLAACTPPVTPAATGPCNAQAAQGYVGKTATAEVVEAARKAAGAQMARTLKPDQVVTMEYREDRLNVDVNATNAITGVRCG